ncbi:MAG: periplasmic heavy metal sensor [Bacteroidales bacterium]|nr:periplasmic heavy metal sensor [Bacteroidales bacterium]MBN2764523.1 periplasmic heavy metal sensor [Bacteroidales bacterium]
MRSEKKQKILVWIVAVLALMNISTLATILVHTNQAKKSETVTTTVQRQAAADAERFGGRYFCDQLDLDADQMRTFRNVNTVFRQQARDITIDLALYRRQMLTEMAAGHSDTNRLYRLSDSIGHLHSDLKKLTFRYYLDIKSICSPQQQEKLERLFGTIMARDTQMGYPGRQGPKGRPRAKQEGIWFRNKFKTDF